MDRESRNPGSYEESCGAGGNVRPRSTLILLLSTWEVSDPPEIKREKKKTFLIKRKTLMTVMGRDKSSDDGQEKELA